MSLQHIRRVVACAALLVLCIAGAGWLLTRSVAGQETKQQPLHGAAALERLKQDGQYESLQAAMQQQKLAAAGFAGLDQINLSLPRALIGRGEMGVQLRVDGVAANPARISVR